MVFSKYYSFLLRAFLGIFFGILVVLSISDPLPPATIPTLGFQNDFVILKDYLESGRIYSGWIFTVDKYELLNQKFGNIFSYFELPANSDWKIVPLKWPWKIFLKAPIFILSGIFFPALWKFLWWFLLIWFSLILYRRSFKKDTIIFCILIFSFVPFQLFDLEYSVFFLAVSSLYLFFTSRNIAHLFLYFLFWIYASISRADFFLFFSFLNIFLGIRAIFSKTYSHLYYILISSSFFLIVFCLLNKIYYWGFLTLGYEVERAGSSSFADAANQLHQADFFSRAQDVIERIFSFVLPFGFHLQNTFENVLYVMYSQSGFLFCLTIPFFLSTNRKSIFSKDKGLRIAIWGIILYGFILYGSHEYFYKPDLPTFSSYTRYFGVFIFLFWLSFYSWFLSLPRSVKILFCCFLIKLIFTGIHFTQRANNDLYSVQYIQNLHSYIPSWSVILPLRPVQFLLSDYKILQPSGLDTEEYRVYFTYWRTQRPTSIFLEKIHTFVRKSQTNVYVVWRGEAFSKIINFFNRYSDIKITFWNGYALIESI